MIYLENEHHHVICTLVSPLLLRGGSYPVHTNVKKLRIQLWTRSTWSDHVALTPIHTSHELALTHLSRKCRVITIRLGFGFLLVSCVSEVAFCFACLRRDCFKEMTKRSKTSQSVANLNREFWVDQTNLQLISHWCGQGLLVTRIFTWLKIEMNEWNKETKTSKGQDAPV